VKLNDDSALQRFNISSVKKCITAVVPNMITVEEPLNAIESIVPAPENPSIVSVVGNKELFRVMITEVLSPGDPCGESPEFLEAKLAELSGLESKGTWKEVWEKDVPLHSNKMRVRVVLTIKNKGTEEEVLKAHFVAQGFCDKEKNAIVHTAVLSRHALTRIITSLASAFGWNIQ
jgi:adenine deaminase